MNTYTSTPDYYNDYLMHYGVKGMHWGQRKARPISLGRIRRKKTSSKVVKAKKRKGYSDAMYDRYRAQGMSHDQAISAARDHRRRTIRNVAIGAAVLTVTALAARTAYNRGFNVRGLTQAQVYEKRAAKAAARKDYKNFKFKNQNDYMRAKASAAETEWMKAGRKGEPHEFYKYVDEDTIKKYAKSLYKGQRRYRKYY